MNDLLYYIILYSTSYNKAFPAVIAAYTQCSSWVDKTRRIYRDNFLTVKNFFLQEKYKNLVDVVEQEVIERFISFYIQK
jgi:bifunctional pyridoxal-dependent enzyme with beta-cystathionase and maltose regulon repressor activities